MKIKSSAISILWFFSVIPAIFFSLFYKSDLSILNKIPFFILLWIFFPFVYRILDDYIEDNKVIQHGKE